MRVKSIQEIAALDEDLNLFEEDEWKFMGVTEDDENFEFFNDVRDIDFLDVHSNIRLILPFCIIGALILISGFWLYNIISSRQDSSYIDFKNKLTEEASIDYVDGTDVDSARLISINQSLQNYCKVLESGRGYKDLNNLCESTSTFYDSYNTQLCKMSSTFDAHDCYARMISEFGTYIKCSKIDRAIEKDGIIYVYADLVVPDKDSIYEWLHLYSYNLTKYFNSNAINKMNIVRFLLNTMKDNPIPCNTQSFVFEYSVEPNGTVKLLDDSQIMGICKTAYNYAISQTSKTLGGNLTANK